MVLVGLAAVIAGLGALALPASAGLVNTAQAKVAALRAEALYEGAQVHAWTARYQADVATADYLHAQEIAERSALTSLQGRLRSTRALLEQEATLAYAGALSTDANAAPSAEDLVGQIERAGYESVAADDVSDTVTQFQREQLARTTTLAAYNLELHGDLVALRSASSARTRALAQAITLQSLLDQARSRLATLTAAAATRARTGLPVGDGLVRAVTVQLSGAATPPPASSPPTTVVSFGPAGGARAPAPAHLVLRAPAQTVARSTRARSDVRTVIATSAAKPATPAGANADPSPTSTTVPTTPAATTTTSAATTTTSAATTTTPAATTTTPAATTTSTAAAATTTTTAIAAANADADAPPAPGMWQELRECESGDNYQEDTGNGYFGAYQFSSSTWTGLGYPGRPDLEPYWMQDEAAARLQGLYGWGQWPACSAALGL
jgi:hypothetical protein